MKTYIALLRGINVRGQKKIKMADLKILFEKIGFGNVRTYIQSGNIIFDDSSTKFVDIESKIEKAIERHYGFDMKVLVKSPDEFKQVLQNNPFIQKKKSPAKMYATFLSNIPSEDNVSRLREKDFMSEEYSIDGRNIYLFLPDGYGKAKLNNNFLEKELKITATTRNWITVNRLFEMASAES